VDEGSGVGVMLLRPVISGGMRRLPFQQPLVCFSLQRSWSGYDIHIETNGVLAINCVYHLVGSRLFFSTGLSPFSMPTFRL